MDDFLKFFEKNNAQKQINTLEKKYKNKKIMLYGAGLYAFELSKNYDISGLNAIGIADKRFSNEKHKENFIGLKTYSPEELIDMDLDVILLSVQEYKILKGIIVKTIVKKRANKNVKVLPIIKKPFLHNIIKIIEE